MLLHQPVLMGDILIKKADAFDACSKRAARAGTTGASLRGIRLAGKQTLIDGGGGLIEAAKEHALERLRGNAGGRLVMAISAAALRGEGIDAGADGREGNRPDLILRSEGKAADVAVCEKRIFVVRATPATLGLRYEDPGCGKTKAWRGFRLTGPAAVQLAAGRQQLLAGGSVDRPIHPTPTK